MSLLTPMPTAEQTDMSISETRTVAIQTIILGRIVLNEHELRNIRGVETPTVECISAISGYDSQTFKEVVEYLSQTGVWYKYCPVNKHIEFYLNTDFSATTLASTLYFETFMEFIAWRNGKRHTMVTDVKEQRHSLFSELTDKQNLVSYSIYYFQNWMSVRRKDTIYDVKVVLTNSEEYCVKLLGGKRIVFFSDNPNLSSLCCSVADAYIPESMCAVTAYTYPCLRGMVLSILNATVTLMFETPCPRTFDLSLLKRLRTFDPNVKERKWGMLPVLVIVRDTHCLSIWDDAVTEYNGFAHSSATLLVTFVGDAATEKYVGDIDPRTQIYVVVQSRLAMFLSHSPHFAHPVPSESNEYTPWCELVVWFHPDPTGYIPDFHGIARVSFLVTSKHETAAVVGNRKIVQISPYPNDTVYNNMQLERYSLKLMVVEPFQLHAGLQKFTLDKRVVDIEPDAIEIEMCHFFNHIYSVSTHCLGHRCENGAAHDVRIVGIHNVCKHVILPLARGFDSYMSAPISFLTYFKVVCRVFAGIDVADNVPVATPILPTHPSFSTATRCLDMDVNETCYLCLEPQMKKDVVVLPCMKHAIHAACYTLSVSEQTATQTWSCGVCRSVFNTSAHPVHIHLSDDECSQCTLCTVQHITVEPARDSLMRKLKQNLHIPSISNFTRDSSKQTVLLQILRTCEIQKPGCKIAIFTETPQTAINIASWLRGKSVGAQYVVYTDTNVAPVSVYSIQTMEYTTIDAQYAIFLEHSHDMENIVVGMKDKNPYKHEADEIQVIVLNTVIPENKTDNTCPF